MSASNYVSLKDGPVVPVAVLKLAWSLEDRGCVLRVDDGVLLAGPRERLTDDDREQIRRWRNQLIALALYEAPRIQ